MAGSKPRPEDGDRTEGGVPGSAQPGLLAREGAPAAGPGPPGGGAPPSWADLRARLDQGVGAWDTPDFVDPVDDWRFTPRLRVCASALLAGAPALVTT
ncbi:hypothetical protein NDU88_006692 [Pleurodeles waltl]|uniref:Uncharacterized protein n=1 Tax=Pleurodeles waltl TaxID=8319 RepID=A0AAV7QMI4_PLEWA|nr:hypothetical protein NDU88_006692 [Pleurodeles waltl]